MIWIAAGLGFLLTLFGASAAAALITSSRNLLADAVARRLRGATESLSWLAPLERDLTAASATTTLGIAVLGAVFPAMIAGATLLEFGVLLVLGAMPVIVFSAYLLPRWLTRARAARVAERLRPLLEPWSKLLGALLPARTTQEEVEITSLWGEGSESGAEPDDELARVGGVLTFAQRPIREVMTPRTDLVSIPEEASVDEVRQAFVQSGYTRIPVYRGTLDEIVGMVHAFDLFRLSSGDPMPVRPVAVAPASRNSGDVLLDMQRERRHLAVVLDEYGGTLGIVTLEDLLEAMVGEIVDEDEPVPALRGAGPDLLEASGSLPVADVEERFGVGLPEGKSGTIGGRLVELAGRIPAPGERFLIRGLELDVLDASPTRVDRVLVRRCSPALTALDRAAP
jgi:CBS domain containing-hemolysin-like protein